MKKIKTIPTKQALLLVLSVAILGVLWFYTFCHLPFQETSLAIDWKVLWRDTFHGQVVYGRPGGLFLPPWGLLILIPLTYLPLCIGWGVMALWAFGGAFVWAPPWNSWRKHLPSLLVLLAAFPLLRQLADGNIEGLILGGLWLSWLGVRDEKPAWVALGAALTSLKPQVSTLVLLYLGFQMVRTWKRKNLFRVGIPLLALIALTMLWQGKAWLAALFPADGLSAQMGRGMLWDMSWWTTASRWGISPGLQILGALLLLWLGGLFWKKIGRTHPWTPGMALTLVGINLLLSPYAAANSFLDVLVIGFTSLSAAGFTFLAWAAVLVADVPLLRSPAWRYAHSSNWYTGETLALLALFWLLTLLSQKGTRQ